MRICDIRTGSSVTREEVAAKRASLHVGDIMPILVTRYNADMTETRREEPCTVEAVSQHVVIFRTANGMRESKTLVELCLMDRGVRV